MKHKMQFSGLNLIQRLNERLKQLIDIMETMGRETCPGIGEIQRTNGTKSRLSDRRGTVAREFSLTNSCEELTK
jgi:hypothetical protein